MRRNCIHSLLLITTVFFVSSCDKSPEMTLEEIEAYRASANNDLIQKSISKPWKDEPWVDGKVGGTWNGTISADPKTFNILIAERDASSTALLNSLLVPLVDYNTVKKEWQPYAASFEIKTDLQNDKLDLIYTLRDDLYWSFYGEAKKPIKVTSDDVVFWYNEILCDEEMGSSAYNSQFMDLKDGSEGLITCEKIDDRSFVFHFPGIVAEPLLQTNMTFGPSFIYKKAKDEGGAKKVKDILSIETDPKTIPSMGEYFITEYTPGQRVVYERNPAYYKKDGVGEGINYPQKKIYQIVSEPNTNFLLFKEGKIETFSPSPEQLEEVVTGSKNLGQDGYTVFNSAGGLSAPFFSFNQNPQNKAEPYYKWFTKKEFRQAVSCLINRERIISQSYRGLAEPKYNFFPEPNAFFNEKIRLEYRFSHPHAQKLLETAGFVKRDDGFLYDSDGVKVEFSLAITPSSPVLSDIAQIICDECKKEGITINVIQVDFQKLIEQLTATYDWQTTIIGLGGSSLFPSQGSNVWLSSGNLHMWNPLQKEPATDWEGRVDKLYKEASCIVDVEEARPLWDEYQRIILEQCPVIYLVRNRSFFAINNRWDLSNVYFDNIIGAETEHVFIREF